MYLYKDQNREAVLRPLRRYASASESSTTTTTSTTYLVPHIFISVYLSAWTTTVRKWVLRLPVYDTNLGQEAVPSHRWFVLDVFFSVSNGWNEWEIELLEQRALSLLVLQWYCWQWGQYVSVCSLPKRLRKHRWQRHKLTWYNQLYLIHCSAYQFALLFLSTFSCTTSTCVLFLRASSTNRLGKRDMEYYGLKKGAKQAIECWLGYGGLKREILK